MKNNDCYRDIKYLITLENTELQGVICKKMYDIIFAVDVQIKKKVSIFI